MTSTKEPTKAEDDALIDALENDENMGEIFEGDPNDPEYYKQRQAERSSFGGDRDMAYGAEDYTINRDPRVLLDTKKKVMEAMEGNQARKIAREQRSELSQSDAMDVFMGSSNRRTSGSRAMDSEDDTWAATKQKIGKSSKKSSKNAMDLVADDSEEVVKLCESFKIQLKEVKERVVPLLERLRKSALPTNKGLSYMEVKLRIPTDFYATCCFFLRFLDNFRDLLLAYCIDVAFYLLLKTEGTSITDHPVIEQLVLHRTFLQRVSSLDSKLKYQIDKLLRVATTGDVANRDLSYKPSIDAFEEGSEEDDDEDDGTRLYKPPTNLATEMVQKGADAETKSFKRAKRSALADFLKQEFGEGPEEDTTTGIDAIGRTKAHAKLLQKQREWEEDNYKRAKGMKTGKVKAGQFNPLAGIERFGDIADWENKKEQAAKIPEFEQMREIQQDEDLRDFFDGEPTPVTPSKRKLAAPESSSDDEDDEDLAFVRGENVRPRKKQRLAFDYHSDSVKEGSKRAINDQIYKSRGILRRQKSNPRTANRKRATDKEKRRGVAKMRDKSKVYTGEQIGDTKVVRSRQFKE